jgi:hypothetical protein
LYNDIQDLSDDNKYTTDVEVSVEYMDSAERALLKAKRDMEKRLVSTGERPDCKSVTDWMELLEKLKTKEEGGSREWN